jgi:hypothetical protein
MANNDFTRHKILYKEENPPPEAQNKIKIAQSPH